MGVTRLNHAVLYVRQVERSVGFYRDTLGFEIVHAFPGAAFLRAPQSTNDHDLGLFEIGAATDSEAGRGRVGLYHLAWEVDTLAELGATADRLSAVGALVGASDHRTTKSLYAHDPDGLEFEVCWIVPAAHLTEQLLNESAGAIRPLDLAAEIAAYGAHTKGGVGVSVPV